MNFFENLDTPTIVLDKNDRKTFINVKFKDKSKIPSAEDSKKITISLLKLFEDCYNSIANTREAFQEFKALQYLILVSMSLAEDERTIKDTDLKVPVSIPKPEEASTMTETVVFEKWKSRKRPFSLRTTPKIEETIAGGPGSAATPPPGGTTAEGRGPGGIGAGGLMEGLSEDDSFQKAVDMSLADTIKLKFKVLGDETLCDKFQYFLNYSSDIDKVLDKIIEDREINDTENDGKKLYNSLIKLLKSSDDDFFIALREYILNRPDNPLGSNSGSISHFKDLKEASAIGVLVTSQETSEIKHSYEAREQAVNFLCPREKDDDNNNKYEIKDEQNEKFKGIDISKVKSGIKSFQEDENKLFSRSTSFKGFKDFENGIKPILSSIPPLQTALSTLGLLFLGNRESDNTIHGIKFKPSDDPTRTNVKKIIKSTQFHDV